MPAIITAFHSGTPAIAPAPTTLNPEAANTATMRKLMLFKLFTFAPHFVSKFPSDWLDLCKTIHDALRCKELLVFLE